MSYVLNFNSVPDSYMPTSSSSRFSFVSAEKSLMCHNQGRGAPSRIAIKVCFCVEFTDSMKRRRRKCTGVRGSASCTILHYHGHPSTPSLPPLNGVREFYAGAPLP